MLSLLTASFVHVRTNVCLSFDSGSRLGHDEGKPFQCSVMRVEDRSPHRYRRPLGKAFRTYVLISRRRYLLPRITQTLPSDDPSDDLRQMLDQHGSAAALQSLYITQFIKKRLLEAQGNDLGSGCQLRIPRDSALPWRPGRRSRAPLGHSSLAQTDEPASAQMLKCSRWIDTQQSDCKVVQTDPNTTVAISRLDWDERQRRMATVGNDG